MSSGPGGGTAPTQNTPRVLTLANLTEPSAFNLMFSPGSPGGSPQAPPIAHNFLVVQDDHGLWVPQLAQDQISVEKDTWRLNPDGTMDTIWRIRPNVQWHDGETFTAEDLLFTVAIVTDSDIVNNAGPARSLMVSAMAPDAQTVSIHWSAPFVDADRAPGLIPIPKHLLEDQYRSDKAALPNSLFFGQQFIGLGPYRLVTWQPGSSMEFTRFDQYFRGRPAFDTVVLRFFSDPATMVAGSLAGQIDVVSGLGVRIEEALEARRRWEGTNNQVFGDPSGRIRALEIQHRPEYARPTQGLTVQAVRQALYHAIDRPQIATLMLGDLGRPADSWFAPNDPLRPRVESTIPQFPYDPRRAQELLSQAGWNRSSDGALVHASTGERFDVELWNTESSGAEKETSAVADFWRLMGARPTLNIIPAALIPDREYRSKLPGAGITGPNYDGFYTDRLHSKSATSPANRWSASNRGGYSNPRVDALLDRLVVTIPKEQRVPLQQELLKEQMGDVANMPLYWDIDVVLALGRVKGLREPAVTGVKTWNIWEWEPTS